MLALEQPQSKFNLWSLATMSTEEKCCLYRKSCWYTTNLLLLQCYSVTPAHLLLVGNLSSVCTCSCSCCISKCLWIDSCNFLICPLLAWRHFQAVCVFSSSAKAQYRQLANIRWISQWLLVTRHVWTKHLSLTWNETWNFKIIRFSTGLPSLALAIALRFLPTQLKMSKHSVSAALRTRDMKHITV